MYKYALFTVLLFLLSCKEKEKQKIPLSAVQLLFANKLLHTCSSWVDEKNAVKKKDIYDNYLSWINNYSDSIVFVNNWRGLLKNVKIFDAKALNATTISFDIEFPIADAKKIEIEFERYLKKGEENKNFIYNQLKSIQARQWVSFDGTFKVDKSRKIKFGGEFGTYDRENYNICEPRFEMDISSIKPDSITDSHGLIDIKRLIAEQIKISEQAANKKISGRTQKYLLGQLEEKKNIIKPSLSKLEIEEANYLFFVLISKLSE